MTHNCEAILLPPVGFLTTKKATPTPQSGNGGKAQISLASDAGLPQNLRSAIIFIGPCMLNCTRQKYGRQCGFFNTAAVFFWLRTGGSSCAIQRRS